MRAVRRGASGLQSEVHQKAEVSQTPHAKLTVRVNAKVLLRSRPVASTACFGLHRQPLPADGPVLLMSVPRRVLRRAVDRNVVRRIARESLRAQRRGACGLALMLKLKRVPQGFDVMASRARKARWREELDRLFGIGLGREQ